MSNMNEQKQYIEVPATPPPKTSAAEWVKITQDAIVGVVVAITPLVGIIAGLKIWKIKKEINTTNRVRRAAAEAAGKEYDGDETLLGRYTSFRDK